MREEPAAINPATRSIVFLRFRRLFALTVALDEPRNFDGLALKLCLKLAIVREVQVPVYSGATARIQQRQHALRTDLGLEPGKCPGRQHQPDDAGRHKDVPGLAARDKRVDPAVE